MKYNLVYLGTCNSQYFQGSYLPVVQVLVDGTTTLGSLREQLEEYVNFEVCEYSLTESDYNGNMLDRFALYLTAVQDFWLERQLDNSKLLNENLEIPVGEEEDEWDCYCYFGIEEVND